VFAVSDPVRGAVPHATVTLRPRAEPAGVTERLQRYLKQELAPYKCPRVIQIVGGQVR
jgi:acyl-coenzyme A synthetase/AMP-(fatty) acid ligase